jgi:hypothetical protein
MSKTAKYMIPFVGAGALLASVFTGALASRPAPLHDLSHAKAKKFTVDGRLTVTDVLRANKNVSAYGRLYAHGGEQIWQGLLVRSGGVKSDSLEVTGPITAQNASVTGNLQTGTLQAATINGTGTLTVTGATHIGGTLAADGKITGNGIDAQSGGVSTTGNITAAGINGTSLAVGSISDTGALTAGSITTTGALQAGQGTFNNLQVSGAVNFSNATVSGLTLSSLTGSNITSLSIGAIAGSTAPLSLSSNGRTATLGVNSNGSLLVDSLSLSGAISAPGGGTFGGTLAAGNANFSGALTVAGAINATAITSPIPNGSNVNGPLAIAAGSTTFSGNTVVNGNATIGAGGDLQLATTSGSSGPAHISAANNPDVAGVVTLSVAGGIAAGPGNVMPKYWVTVNNNGNGLFTGFVVNYVTPEAVGSSYTVPFNYHVIGGSS